MKPCMICIFFQLSGFLSMRTRVEHQVSRHDIHGRKSDNTQLLIRIGEGALTAAE